MNSDTPFWIEKFRAHPLSRRQQAVICAALILGYVVARLATLSSPVKWVTALTHLPVVAVAWAFGLPAGALTAILLFLFNLALDRIWGPFEWAQSLSSSGAGGLVILLISATLFGILGNLSRQIRHELNERLVSEEKVRQYASRLDTLRRAQQGILNLQDPDEMVRVLLARLREIGLFEYVGVLLFEPDGSQARMIATHPNSANGLSHPVSLPSLYIGGLERLRQGKTFIVEDLQNLPEVGQAERAHLARGILAIAYFPLLAQGELLGVFSLGYTQPHQLSQEEYEIATEVASSLAVSLQQAALYQSEVAARRQTENLRRSVEMVSSNLKLDEVLQALLKYLGEVVPFDSAAVFLNQQGDFRLVAVRGFKDPQKIIGRKVNPENYFVQNILKTRQPILLEDAERDEHFEKWEIGNIIRGWMALPLLWQEEVIGMLTVDSRKAGVFTGQSLALAQLFARHASIAIQKARLLEEATRRAEEAETLRQAGLALTALLPQQEIFDKVLEQLMRVTQCDSASVLLIEDDELVIVAGRGFPDLDKVLGIRVKINQETPAYIVLNENRPVILPNAPGIYPDFASQPHGYTVSFLCVPLILRGKAIGVLSLDSLQEDYFTPDHARLATAFASQVAIALDNARLMEESLRQAREADTLRKAGVAVTALLPREEIIDRVAEQLMQVVPCDSASVLLREGDELVLVGGRGFPDLSQLLGIRIKTTPEVPSYYVINEKRPLISGNAPLEYPIFRTQPHQYTVSFMSVPLIVRDRVIGVFAIDSLKENHFTQRHAELAMAFATQVAIAIDNSQLYESLRELSIMDPLTGLFSRRHFFEIAQTHLEQALRYRHPLSLIMMDVDRFKSFNDTFGHVLGDRILQHFAQSLRTALRASDVAARYGGDEFVVLLPETGIEEARQAAERLLQSIRQPFEDEAGVFTLSASMGLACLGEGIASRPEDLLEKADKAMYAAKAAGGNRIMTHRGRTSFAE